MGGGSFNSVPIYDGNIMQKVNCRLDGLGASTQLTRRLQSFLCEKGYHVYYPSCLPIVEDIQRKHCYVCMGILYMDVFGFLFCF